MGDDIQFEDVQLPPSLLLPRVSEQQFLTLIACGLEEKLEQLDFVLCRGNGTGELWEALGKLLGSSGTALSGYSNGEPNKRSGLSNNGREFVYHE